MKANIPLTALVGTSELVLTNVNTNTRKYGADGKPIEGQAGDPRIEIIVMDSLEKQSVSVKALPPEMANLTPQQIEDSIKTRKYILLEFVNAVATPYANKSGYGVSYSIKADSVRIVKSVAPTTLQALHLKLLSSEQQPKIINGARGKLTSPYRSI